MPPTRDGLLHDNDVRALEGFSRLRDALFARDLIADARASASGNGAAAAHVLDDDPATFWSPPRGTHSGWLEFTLPQDSAFDVVRLEEAIEHGQHIANYRVDTWQHGAWKPLTWGTTIGHRKLDRTPLTRTRRLRLVVEHAYDTPRLSRVALHRMPTATQA